MEVTCSSEMLVDFQQTHGTISQQAKLFIISAVRTSNPTRLGLFARSIKGMMQDRLLFIDNATF
jgi:hypothetical protein